MIILQSFPILHKKLTGPLIFAIVKQSFLHGVPLILQLLRQMLSFLENTQRHMKNFLRVINIFPCIPNICLFFVYNDSVLIYRTALTIITASKYSKDHDKTGLNGGWNHV